ncbi:synapsin-like [Tropilaelaps mercedesae]|uniref:Synapsin-like n=1 Tax=Tropilaelaps mercedesae TaxID=418985 RepID=A0A1V9XRV4_9ACAR|nr:synapsin-like [Tropilaelaps mercedesae]
MIAKTQLSFRKFVAKRFSSSDLSGDLDPDFASGVAGVVQQPVYGANAEQYGVGPTPSAQPPGVPSAPQTPLTIAGQPSQQVS